MSCINRLKSVGERTEPCGTPLGKLRVCEGLPLYVVCACRPERKLASHFLTLFWMCVLSILFMRMCLGTVSNALLMSMAAMSVLCAGFCVFSPSSVVCVRVVRSVVVEWCGLKPCCVGDSGMSELIWFRTSLSKIFEGLGRSEIGLYEAGSVGFLLGFRIGMMLACFQEVGMVLCVSEWL